MAAEMIRTTANLAAELATVYTRLVLAEARMADAAEAGDIAGFDQAREETAHLWALIERVQIEMAVVRSAFAA